MNASPVAVFARNSGRGIHAEVYQEIVCYKCKPNSHILRMATFLFFARCSVRCLRRSSRTSPIRRFRNKKRCGSPNSLLICTLRKHGTWLGPFPPILWWVPFSEDPKQVPKSWFQLATKDNHVCVILECVLSCRLPFSAWFKETKRTSTIFWGPPFRHILYPNRRTHVTSPHFCPRRSSFRQEFTEQLLEGLHLTLSIQVAHWQLFVRFFGSRPLKIMQQISALLWHQCARFVYICKYINI